METQKECRIPTNRRVTYENIKYGTLVEVLAPEGGSYHSGCKVMFFNKKGVLIGNKYQFLPYDRIRLREGKDSQYPRFFMGKNYLKKRTPISEKVKTWLFIGLCNIVTGLIKFTQNRMD